MIAYLSTAYAICSIAMFLASERVETGRYLTGLVRAVLWPLVLLLWLFERALR